MNTNFYYDPQKQGYDTAVWTTIAGTPSVVANNLVLNAATTIGHSDIYSGEITFSVKNPLAPVAGQNKRFGLAQLNLGAFLGFRMTDDKFYYESVDGLGQNTNAEITWDAAWTATATVFKIMWTNFNVEFWIGSNKIATLNVGLAPHNPLSLYVKNTNADALEVVYIEIRNAIIYGTTHINADVTIDPGDIEIGAVELKNATDDTRAIINAANTGRAATNAVVLTQLIDASGNVNKVETVIPSTLTAGEKVVATSGTAETLGASLATKSIYVRAKSANTGNAYVGDSSVDKTTSQQIILNAGSAVSMDIANRASIYVDVDVNGEGVDYLCFS